MAITFGVATTAGTTSAQGRTGNGTFTVTLPTGWAIGQLAIIVLYSDQGSGSISAGWDEITGSPWGSNTPKLQAFTRVLQSGDTAPTITISGSGTNIAHCAGMMTFNDVDPTTPVDVIGTASVGSGTPMTAGAINTAVDGAWAVGLCGRGDNENASGQSFGGSTTGVTERLDAGSSQGNDSQVSAYSKEITTAGTTGDGSATTSATDPWVSVLISLKPYVAPLRSKVKISGTFASKPSKVKLSGTFAIKPMKVKVGGTFVT